MSEMRNEMGFFKKDEFERRVPSDKELRAESFKKNSSDKKVTTPKPVASKPTRFSYDSYNKSEVKKAEPTKPIFTPAPSAQVKSTSESAPSQVTNSTSASAYTSDLFKPEEKKVEEKPVFVPAPVKIEEKKVEEKPVFVPLKQDNAKNAGDTSNFKQPTSSVYKPKPTSNRKSQRNYVSSEPSAVSSAADVIKVILTIISVLSIFIGIGSRVFVATNKNQQKLKQAEQAHEYVTMHSLAKIDLMRIYSANEYSRKELREEFDKETTYASVDTEALINEYVESGIFDFFDKAYTRLQSIIATKSDDFKNMSDEDIEKCLKAAGFEAPEIKYAIDQYHLADGKV